MKKNWKCNIGIHSWRESTTFNNAVPLYVRNELNAEYQVCIRCCKIKRVKVYE